MQLQKYFGPILRLPRSQSIVQFVRLSRARCIQMPRAVNTEGEGGAAILPPPSFRQIIQPLFQTGRADYAHLIATRPPRFLDLPMVLRATTNLVTQHRLFPF